MRSILSNSLRAFAAHVIIRWIQARTLLGICRSTLAGVLRSTAVVRQPAWGLLGVCALVLASCRTPQSPPPPPIPAQAPLGLLPKGKAAQDPDSGYALVRGTTGVVSEYMTWDGLWRRLKVGLRLRPGDVIRTGPKCLVDVSIRQGNRQSVMRVHGDSILTLDRLHFTENPPGDTVFNNQFTLVQGTMLGNVQLVPRGSRYAIETLAGTVLINPGTYMLCYCGELQLVSGQASIETATNSVTVEAGQFFNPVSGKVEARLAY